MVFCFECADPFGTVVDAVKRCVSVVGGLATKSIERGLHCWDRSEVDFVSLPLEE